MGEGLLCVSPFDCASPRDRDRVILCLVPGTMFFLWLKLGKVVFLIILLKNQYF